MTQLYIHCGFPKTATTTLQSHFFNAHPDILFLGKPFPTDDIRKLMEYDLCALPSQQFDTEAISGTVRQIRDQVEATSASAAVISHEALTHSWYGMAPDIGDMAKRLHDVFPEAKLLFVVRNQRHSIHSYYRQFIAGGGYCAFDTFMELSHENKGSWLSCIDLNNTIKQYEKHFGQERIAIHLFEDLHHDAEGFLKAFCASLGVDGSAVRALEKENVGYFGGELFFRRHINAVLRHDLGVAPLHGFPSRRTGEAFKFNRIVLKKILAHKASKLLGRLFPVQSHKAGRDLSQYIDMFATGNRELNSRYGLGMERFSYPGLETDGD